MYDGTVTMTDPALVATITSDELTSMPDGFVAYVRYDSDAEMPRGNGVNICTMVSVSSRHIDIDDDDAGLGRIRDHYGNTRDSEALVRRYLSIFRPDVLFYSHRDAYDIDGGNVYGYITADRWTEMMGDTEPTQDVLRDAWHAELSEYGRWARGEYYGVTVVNTNLTELAEVSLWGIDDPDFYEGNAACYIMAHVIPDLVAEIGGA